MSTARAILRSYLAPRQVLSEQSSGAGEERALAWVMIASMLFFIARLPAISRQAHLNPDGPPFDALAGGAFLGAVLLAPLFFYALAALSHFVARVFGGKATWLEARLALFWALLAVTPLVLFQGLVAGFIGEGVQLTIVSVVTFVAFLYIWLSGLSAAERGA